ncbi:PAS domain-containing sensor histidine kinase [Rhabdochromatium marinum]|uniref:PAS domain-containing sensor histidine kinase n=1 Tax=Rhabdochromatium marinum TaxID=48729 RepID=UPI001908F069|nr:PAS domain-containing sensor histidine kinase [Rhabdochromatium marinum]MBK1647361.1 hypothetical protein [Rhabdochromatium marinum]
MTAPSPSIALSQRMLQVITATPVGICITNAQGMFEFVNPAYCRFYGYSAAELLGQHFTLVVPPDNQALMTELHDRFIAGHSEVRGEWEVVDRHGATRQIIADATLIEGNDGQPRKVTFIMDITERTRNERMREDIERLMRHDLRTPLNAIINIPALLRDDGNLTAEQNELLEIIERSAHTMAEMIEASLNLYKLEAGTYPLQGKRLDLLELLARVLADGAKSSAHQGQHSVLMLNGQAVRAQDQYHLHGEPLLYYNLFANLIKNAFEASPAGARVSLNVAPGPNVTRVEVHNQGSIPEGIQPQLFDKYVTHNKVGGSGLGTYSAKLITEAVGGSIGVHSTAESGTLFWVELPQNTRSAGAPVELDH